MRPIHEIAADMHGCARSWVPDAKLVGNVRADEVIALIDRLEALEAKAAMLGAALKKQDAEVERLRRVEEAARASATLLRRVGLRHDTPPKWADEVRVASDRLDAALEER